MTEFKSDDGNLFKSERQLRSYIHARDVIFPLLRRLKKKAAKRKAEQQRRGDVE